MLRAAPGSEIQCLGDYSHASRLLEVTVMYTGDPISDEEYALIFPNTAGLTSGEGDIYYSAGRPEPCFSAGRRATALRSQCPPFRCSQLRRRTTRRWECLSSESYASLLLHLHLTASNPMLSDFFDGSCSHPS